MRASRDNGQKQKESGMVQSASLSSQSHRGTGINGTEPEPHLQTEREANHAVTNNKKFGVQNNA